MVPDSPNHPAAPFQTPCLVNRKARCRPRRGVGWVNTGKFHEQPEIFSGAGSVDMLNVSTVQRHSGQPPMIRKSCSTFVVAKVQVLLERKRNCRMLVTWKAFQRWRREGKGIRRERWYFGAIPFMERSSTRQCSTILL